jgi:hypothetical protein
MFYFRINKLKIKDNKEGKFLGFLGSGTAEVKLVSFVTNGNDDLPALDELREETDAEKQKEIIKLAVSQVAASRVFTEVHDVKDNHIMTFGDVGYVLYQADEIPNDFNWVLSAIESDSDVRRIGEQIDSVVNHDKFDDFAKNLITLLAGATNPAYLAGVGIAKFITSVLASNLKDNRDDQIGILYMSLNKQEHYQHGVRNKENVSDLSGNMLVDYSLFGFDSSETEG